MKTRAAPSKNSAPTRRCTAGYDRRSAVVSTLAKVLRYTSSRSAGLMPASTTCAEIPRSSWTTRLARIARWSSSSEGAAVSTFRLVDQRGGMSRLLEQHRHGRYVGVPFDERRHRTEARERLGIECPHLRRDARAVIVDAKRSCVVDPPDGMAGEMDLADRLRRQRREIRRSPPAVVARADVNVVHVAENSATRAFGHPGEKFPLRYRRVPELQVGGGVLNKDLALQAILGLRDVSANDPERLFGHRQRQEIGEVVPARDAEGKMLRDQPGLEPLDGLPQAREVRRVQPLRAAERQARAVERDRIVAADRVEGGRSAAASHVVLDMHLEPRRGGRRLEDFLMMPETQPDPGLGRDRATCLPQRSRVRIQSRFPIRRPSSCRPGSWSSRPRGAARRTSYRAPWSPARRRNARLRRSRSWRPC